METKKRSIKLNVIFNSILFVAIVSFFLLLVFYNFVSNTIYERTRSHLSDVVNYVDHLTDGQDLYECLQTRQLSEKYKELQADLNVIVDDFELYYLYIVFPEDDVMINVISATSAAEREAGETDVPLYEASDYYEEDVLKLYEDAMKSEDISYFHEDSEWGLAYTACKPLKNVKGETFALICADAEMSALRESIWVMVIYMIMFIAPLSIIFGAFMLSRLDKNVIGPITTLEKSTVDYANSIKENTSLKTLEFKEPEFRHENEVSSLSHAIKSLSIALIEDVEKILSARKKAAKAEKEAEKIQRLAHKDALTHLQTVLAFEEEKENVLKQIARGQTELAYLMVDLNDLKGINDRYGHDAGNEFIYGSGKIISSTFVHSPVYRIGGDEFLILLRNYDFEHRDELIDQMVERFEQSSHDESVEPYKRYSAAYGLAVFGEDENDDLDRMFKRADNRMYENKKAQKESKG